MEITINKTSDCQATLQATATPSEVSAVKDSVIAAYASGARIPGFRPGKAPKSVIVKRYAEAIKDELDYRMQSDIQEKALEENPELKVLDFGKPECGEQADGSYSLSSTLTIVPAFELPEYMGLEVTVPSTEVSGIRPHGHAADGAGLGEAGQNLLLHELPAQLADEVGALGIERGDAAIAVQIALLARGKNKMTRLDGLGEENLQQFFLGATHNAGYSTPLPGGNQRKSRAMSGGRGDSTQSMRPPRGKQSRAACSAWRGSSSRSASSGVHPPAMKSR